VAKPSEKKINFNKVLKPDLTIARYQPSKGDDDNVITRFIDKHYQAELLLQIAYLTRKEDKLNDFELDEDPIFEMAKQNFVVTLISELEIYLKGIIRRYNWINEGGYGNLLRSEQINLYDAHRMFVSGHVSRESIIADHYSFQSVDQIQTVFNQLTGTKFLLEIEKAQSFNVNGKLRTFEQHTKAQGVKDWRKYLIDAYERRHLIIHEGLTQKLDLRETRSFGTVLFDLVLTIVYYCNRTQKLIS
jgi:hypothetical protein